MAGFLKVPAIGTSIGKFYKFVATAGFHAFFRRARIS
jgi:hypothetical protein